MNSVCGTLLSWNLLKRKFAVLRADCCYSNITFSARQQRAPGNMLDGSLRRPASVVRVLSSKFSKNFSETSGSISIEFHMQHSSLLLCSHSPNDVPPPTPPNLSGTYP